MREPHRLESERSREGGGAEILPIIQTKFDWAVIEVTPLHMKNRRFRKDRIPFRIDKHSINLLLN